MPLYTTKVQHKTAHELLKKHVSLFTRLKKSKLAYTLAVSAAASSIGGLWSGAFKKKIVFFPSKYSQPTVAQQKRMEDIIREIKDKFPQANENALKKFIWANHEEDRCARDVTSLLKILKGEDISKTSGRARGGKTFISNILASSELSALEKKSFFPKNPLKTVEYYIEDESAYHWQPTEKSLNKLLNQKNTGGFVIETWIAEDGRHTQAVMKTKNGKKIVISDTSDGVAAKFCAYPKKMTYYHAMTPTKDFFKRR